MSVPGGLLAGIPSARGRVLGLPDRFRRAAETRTGRFAGVWEIRRHVADLGGNDARLVAYLLKSATITDGRGPVDGKRAGTSRVLGGAARLRRALETVSQAISTKSERA